MRGVTHRPMGSTWWLLGSGAVNAVGLGIAPPVVIAGAFIAPIFAAGKASPDGDVTWLKFLGHRQGTHRPDSTALVLTALTAVGWVALHLVSLRDARWGTGALVSLVAWQVYRHLRRRWHRKGAPTATLAALVVGAGLFALGPDQLQWLIWAPVTGWWSHLVGDTIFGRIPVGDHVGRVLVKVLPARLIRKGGGHEPWFVGVGLDTDGLVERGNRRLPDRNPVTGLHQTVKALPFAPTTWGLRLATLGMAWLTVAPWVASVHPAVHPLTSIGR